MEQQIAYLFGEESLFTDGEKDISEEAQYRIVAYLGVMIGAAGSASLLMNVSKKVGVNLGKSRYESFDKNGLVSSCEKVGALLGAKVTKKTVEKSISKMVPIIGGVISGGLTYVTFRPMGGKLADTFLAMSKGELVAENGLLIKEEFLQAQSETPDIIDGEIL